MLGRLLFEPLYRAFWTGRTDDYHVVLVKNDRASIEHAQYVFYYNGLLSEQSTRKPEISIYTLPKGLEEGFPCVSWVVPFAANEVRVFLRRSSNDWCFSRPKLLTIPKAKLQSQRLTLDNEIGALIVKRLGREDFFKKFVSRPPYV